METSYKQVKTCVSVLLLCMGCCQFNETSWPLGGGKWAHFSTSVSTFGMSSRVMIKETITNTYERLRSKCRCWCYCGWCLVLKDLVQIKVLVNMHKCFRIVALCSSVFFVVVFWLVFFVDLSDHLFVCSEKKTLHVFILNEFSPVLFLPQTKLHSLRCCVRAWCFFGTYFYTEI